MKDIVKSLCISLYRFYILRTMGILPEPQSGFGIQKHYSPEEIAKMRDILKKVK
jgi:hypothetical protein